MARTRRAPESLADAETVHLLSKIQLTPSQLKSADKQLLLSLQGQLLLGSEWGVIEVANNLVADHAVYDSKRTYRLECAIPNDMEIMSAEAQFVWQEIIRYAIARRAFSLRGMGTASRPKFSTLLSEVRALGVVAKNIVRREGCGLWDRCTADEFVTWTSKPGVTVCNTLRKMRERGAISAAPMGRRKPIGSEPPRDRTGESEQTKKPDAGDPYLPLPDQFTAAAGQRALYLTEQVGPCLLDALESCLALASRSNGETSNLDRERSILPNRLTKKARSKLLDPIVRGWQWKDVEGRPLAALKFDFVFPQRQSTGFSWPPQSFAQGLAVLAQVQCAHLFLIALSDGGRHGEILSLQESSIRRNDSEVPTLKTRTRKIEKSGARDHEVPLPSSVEFAVIQQERLARLVKSFYGADGKHLWVQISVARGTPLKQFTSMLRSFVRATRVGHLLDGGSLHMHRFRKTLARLVALALIHAPKILMQVFGHKDEQMTIMRYILSSPGLIDEIQEITQELLVLKGVWLIENLEKIQGKGADRLRDHWAQHARLIGNRALEPDSIRSFIEVCFENGQALAFIAPGIICTSFTKGGRCNRHGRGEPDPEHCSPDCESQVACPTYVNPETLDEEDAILNALNTVDYLLDSAAEARKQGEEMLIATFESQVRSMLGRWREVDSHVATHPHGRTLIPLTLVTA